MSTWDDIKPWLAKIAPMLGTAIGGPLGGAAGAIVSSALGAKDASPESLAAAIKTGALTGEQMLALKKAEQDFQIQMTALGYKDAEALAELDFKDRDSARAREIAVRDKTPMILAATYTVGFFAILARMLVKGVPKDGGEALLILLGALAAGSAQVLSYYFGSSSSSAAKDVMLHNSVPSGGK